jgi:DNA-binding XRE family transcriptional regulator
MKPHQQAKAWRRRRGLTQQQLSELTGYTTSMIYKFEAGQMRPGVPASEWSWQRYRMVCAAVDFQMRTGKAFEW